MAPEWRVTVLTGINESDMEWIKRIIDSNGKADTPECYAFTTRTKAEAFMKELELMGKHSYLTQVYQY